MDSPGCKWAMMCHMIWRFSYCELIVFRSEWHQWGGGRGRVHDRWSMLWVEVTCSGVMQKADEVESLVGVWERTRGRRFENSKGEFSLFVIVASRLCNRPAKGYMQRSYPKVRLHPKWSKSPHKLTWLLDFWFILGSVAKNCSIFVL